MHRGEIWWAALGRPAGSGPGYRRPVVVIQSDDFNDSKIRTVVVAVVTSNLWLSAAPGNVLCKRRQTGLPKDSVVNVTQLLTLDKSFLTERAGSLPGGLLADVEEGLRLVLSL